MLELAFGSGGFLHIAQKAVGRKINAFGLSEIEEVNDDRNGEGGQCP